MPNQSVARDVFMYLLVVVVLTMSAVSLGALLFDFVNIYLPDPVRAVCAYDGCTGAVNTEVAVLLVAFPVLVWAWRFIRRDVQADPTKSGLWVRRWMLYLTLFVSGLTTIIDLISLINGWLNGELTLQFFLKVLVVLGIAVAIFSYFLRELRQESGAIQKWVAWKAIILVALALVAGIWTSAPWEARDRADDRDRVYALQSIQSEVVNFWQAKGRLPASLDELNDPIRSFRVPVDPVTAQPYGYERKQGASFELCAVFATASPGPAGVSRPVMPYGGDPYAADWGHAAGSVCFERSIDPQLYPPKQ